MARRPRKCAGSHSPGRQHAADATSRRLAPASTAGACGCERLSQRSRRRPDRGSAQFGATEGEPSVAACALARLVLSGKATVSVPGTPDGVHQNDAIAITAAA